MAGGGRYMLTGDPSPSIFKNTKLNYIFFCSKNITEEFLFCFAPARIVLHLESFQVFFVGV